MIHQKGLKFLAIIRSFYKQSKGAVLFVFCVYFIGVFSLILANVEYFDDIYRTHSGVFDYNWGRLTSDFLARVLNLNHEIQLNIFPYSLLIAIFLLSISSCILCRIINKNFNKLTLLASVALGLSPYFLENLSYKFDSPYMALSVFASIFPFLFLRDIKIFIFISAISLFIMLTTYQASGGIYIIICIFLALRYLTNDVHIRKSCATNNLKAIEILIAGAIGYCIALFLFSPFYFPQGDTYVGTELPDLQHALETPILNLKHYFLMIYSDFHLNAFIYILGALCVMFIVNIVVDSRVSKIKALILAMIALFFMACFSYGLYIVISNPPINFTRALIGFGALLAILAIHSLSSTKFRKIIATITIIIMCQYLIIFANYYGQALKINDNYFRWRMDMAISDIAKYEPYEEGKQLLIDTLTQHIGLAPSIQATYKAYPVITRLVNSPLRIILQIDIKRYYGIPVLTFCDKITDKTTKQETIIDSYYHKIIAHKGEQTCYKVIFHDISNVKPPVEFLVENRNE